MFLIHVIFEEMKYNSGRGESSQNVRQHFKSQFAIKIKNKDSIYVHFLT